MKKLINLSNLRPTEKSKAKLVVAVVAKLLYFIRRERFENNYVAGAFLMVCKKLLTGFVMLL